MTRYQKIAYPVAAVIAAVMIYGLTFSPGAQRCKAAGGTYFLNGDCVRIIYEPVQPLN